MTLTIDLTPELEAQLREEAANKGFATSTFIVRDLEEQLQRRSPQRVLPRLSQDESALLQKINQGLLEATWQEYEDLISKRRAETLTPDEHARLIALSDNIHVVPRSADGNDDEENLARSCQECNNHKFTALTARDPFSGNMVPLYHPRRSNWSDRFMWNVDSSC